MSRSVRVGDQPHTAGTEASARMLSRYVDAAQTSPENYITAESKRTLFEAGDLKRLRREWTVRS